MSTPEIKRGHVLVVEDAEPVREMICKFLAQDGHTFEGASTIQEAMHLIGMHNFDLILLDVYLPDGEATQIIQNVRQNERTKYLPIIVMSGRSDEREASQLIEQGADDFLNKPFRRYAIRARMNNLIGRKSERDAEQGLLSQLNAKRKEMDELLYSVFPPAIAEEIKAVGYVAPRRHPRAAMMFVDIAGFTKYSDEHEPEIVVDALMGLTEIFEEVAARNNVQKIKSIGDAFMGASGLITRSEQPEMDCILCGMELIARASGMVYPWNLRVGVHTGPVVAGVIGARSRTYDVWGDTVNTAARLESAARTNKVCVSEAVWAIVKARCKGMAREGVALKGKGATRVYDIDGLV